MYWANVMPGIKTQDSGHILAQLCTRILHPTHISHTQPGTSDGNNLKQSKMKFLSQQEILMLCKT